MPGSGFTCTGPSPGTSPISVSLIRGWGRSKEGSVNAIVSTVSMSANHAHPSWLMSSRMHLAGPHLVPLAYPAGPSIHIPHTADGTPCTRPFPSGSLMLFTQQAAGRQAGTTDPSLHTALPAFRSVLNPHLTLRNKCPVACPSTTGTK